MPGVSGHLEFIYGKTARTVFARDGTDGVRKRQIDIVIRFDKIRGARRRLKTIFSSLFQSRSTLKTTRHTPSESGTSELYPTLPPTLSVVAKKKVTYQVKN